MSASSMLIESPERPFITCFLDWQGAIVAPVSMQASIPAPLAYTDGVFELDSGRHIPPLSEGIDRRPSDEHSQSSLPSAPLHRDTPHQEVTSDLSLYVLHSWADGLLKLRDALMKIPDPGFSGVDFSPAEHAHDEELRARVRYQGMVEKLVEYVGWMEEMFEEGGGGCGGAGG
ncbi:hypothetical protein IW262DRAFT_1466627 [Armillaria fumosa]|nr:hypothetical protein IW262DRAFT_1466627 [Armillaria fumosa]